MIIKHKMIRITDITIYPVKGLSGQALTHTKLEPESLLAGDRQFGISAGTEVSAQATPDSWLKKAHFLQQMNYETLAALDLSYDSVTDRAVVRHKNEILFSDRLDTEDAGQRFCDCIARFAGKEPGESRLFRLSDGGLSDTKTPFISLGNHASLREADSRMGISSDSRRYRLNILFEGLEAFAEYDLIGKEAQIGDARIRFTEPVGRCAAIEVDPKTATRRKGLVADLTAATGAPDMGVFAMVVTSGHIAVGDQMSLIDEDVQP